MLLTDFLDKLQQVKPIGKGEYQALCPSHADKKPSLHIKEIDGKLLINCKAGCATERILQAINLTVSDLFVDEKHPVSVQQNKKTIAEYSYQDENGQELFQVVRYEPKEFRQRHRNGSGDWSWDVKGIRKVLYHLPEIILENGTIYHVEGEKDADRLWEYGQVATTSPGGAGAWKPEYADYLTGKRIVIIPDNDATGLSYARAVVKSLQGKAREIKCIMLPNAKDFSDWIVDNDVAELPSLEQDISVLFFPNKPTYRNENNTIVWYKNDFIFKAESIRQERTGTHAKISILSDYQVLAWSTFNIERSEDRTRLANQVKKNDENIRQDLDLFCSGLWEFYISIIAPEVMFGDDTIAPPSFHLYPYILEGGGTILFAAPGRGKSHTALIWAQSINAGIDRFWKVNKVPVMYINLERSKESIQRRLSGVNKILGLETSHPLLTFNARGKPLSAIQSSVEKAIKQYGIKLIILDSISRAGYGDLTENRPVNAIIDTLSGLCDSWLAIGHTPRADESHVYGGVMFEAGADLVVQLKSEVDKTKLGLAYEIVKKNDLPDIKPEVWSLEFEGWNIKSFSKAESHEFVELKLQKKPKMVDAVMDFIFNQDSGDATATEISDELGYSRPKASELLNKSGRFVRTRKIGVKQYYGVKDA